MEDVKDFFFTHYVPSNAVLVVAGNVTTDQVKQLSEKWFGPIPSGKKKKRKLPAEPRQSEKRILNTEAKVPANALYKTYHMPGRFHKDYYAVDMLSDILSRGESSRLYQALVKEKEIFNSISSFVMGTVDPGLLVLNGRLKEGVSLADAEHEMDKILQKVIAEEVSEQELQKVKNQSAASLEFGEVEVMNRAMNLAFASLSGDPGLVNKEIENIERVTTMDIQRVAEQILQDENSSVMYYHSIKS
jgi:zinc protease